MFLAIYIEEDGHLLFFFSSTNQKPVYFKYQYILGYISLCITEYIQ